MQSDAESRTSQHRPFVLQYRQLLVPIAPRGDASATLCVGVAQANSLRYGAVDAERPWGVPTRERGNEQCGKGRPMSEQKPANPGRRSFLEDLLTTVGREAGRAVREMRQREVDKTVAEVQQIDVDTPEAGTAPATVDDLSALAVRLDAKLDSFGELVERIVQAMEQSQELTAEVRALLPEVTESAAELHRELVADPPATNDRKDDGQKNESTGDEAEVLRDRREKFWKLITALLGFEHIYDALFETFVAEEVYPWAAEQWRGIFAQAEAAGVIEQSPLASPLPSPTGESPPPVETPTPKPETPTPPRRPSTEFRQAQPTSSGRDTRRTGRIPVPETVTVPAGHFWMGSDSRIDKDARDKELPQHRLYLPGYRIGKYPVTNEEYAAFLAATGHQQPRGWEGNRSKLDHPVTDVSWLDATAYCRWLSEATGQVYRLPSEAEWEKAARGSDGRIYPWGNQPPDERHCNFNGNVGSTTSVGIYPAGVSPYGCYDMAGNVWEWVNSRHEKYPYRSDDGREESGRKEDERRVLRGGSFHYVRLFSRCAYRSGNNPDYRNRYFGFRLFSPGG